MAKRSDDLSVAVSSFKDRAGNICTSRPNGSLLVELDCSVDDGCTEQHHLPECDLSTILNRFVRAQVPVSVPVSSFMDLTNLPDYQESLNSVHLTNKLFDSLPLAVKTAYDQNPALFVKALSDPLQKDRLIALGVFDAPAKPIPVVSSEVSTSGTVGDKSST